MSQAQPPYAHQPRAVRRWEGRRSEALLKTPVNEGWSDEDYIKLCLTLAQEAWRRGEVPVGSVVVHRHPVTHEERIIGRGFNLRETHHDPTAHAEVEALRQASELLGHWRLEECELYVTLEPCVMCSGALVNSRIKRVIYGCHDPKAGGARSLYRLIDDPRLNHRAEVTSGVCAEACAEVLRSFFHHTHFSQAIPMLLLLNQM